ncbi:CRAL-TRIO domain-containing protein C3H8.02 isoform X2 [Canna indica]|uniref:CRAL-TRIO domain-containing protein C3H8.02 isoform X2 n=1 Tax=Canna indica TaxID=4628 RepID=A0AAQ3QMI9_9LILI|nr:CRAL-TRIO domain-containing protein C3H8.02 isoform X2 [Canna indica]
MALLRFRCPIAVPLSSSRSSTAHGRRRLRCSADNQATLSLDSAKLVLEVKEKLAKEHPNLSIGKNGRDDEDMIRWFLKDRKFSVEETTMKLSKAIKWREEFGVSDLCEDSLKDIYGTGKAYVHDLLDNNGRPVLIVVASKHFPSKENTIVNQKLCVYLVEKALSKLPPGTEEILGIIDLRGFGAENGDVLFLKFLFDVFYNYYPRRLGEVLFVDAPLVFQPIWRLVKPMLKSYASLVRFCDMETVKREYFTESTVPADFND